MSRQQRIESILTNNFSNNYCDVLNESHMHSRGEDSHFKVVVVSDAFNGLRAVARHQKVYALFQDEFATGLHALTLHLFTPEEWQQSQSVPDSPTCRGGGKF
jgi:BolA protein